MPTNDELFEQAAGGKTPPVVESTDPTVPAKPSTDALFEQAANGTAPEYTGGQFQEQYARKKSMTGGVSEHDMSEYTRLNTPLYEDGKAHWDKWKAQNQEWTEQAVNGAGRIIAKTGASVIQNLATMGDLTSDFEDMEVGGNALYQLMADWKESVDETLPIYQENPSNSFAWGDSGWWLQNLSGVTESAAAFVLTSYLTGGALGKVF